MTTAAAIPDDLIALRAALAAEQLARREAEARASGAEAMVAHLKLLIAQLRHERFGASSERGRKLLDQLELQLEELETTAAEDEAVLSPGGQADAEKEPARTSIRRKPVRGPLPAHLPRERVVIPGPTASSTGIPSASLLEPWPVPPVLQRQAGQAGRGHHRDAGGDPPAVEGNPDGARAARLPCLRDDQPATGAVPPDRAGPRRPRVAGDDPRGEVLPALAAEPAERNLRPRRDRTRHVDARRLGWRSYPRLRVRSTWNDSVGACTATLSPLVALIQAHVLAAGRLHGDDTTVPVMAKGKTAIGRLWTYVRDDRPFARPAPPAAIFFYSPDRAGEHPRQHLALYAGILQADAYAGFNGLYAEARKPGPVTEGGCWAHGRRKLFDLAQLARAPLAVEAVRRIDAIFDAERAINGVPAEQRLAVRQTQVAPLVADLEIWMRGVRATMSRHADVARAMDSMLKRWSTFSRFLEDGRICLTNNAAERALRGVALGRKAWLFAGNDRGGKRAAAMYSLMITAKLNNVDPRGWLADVLRRINDHPASRLHELLPWNWTHPARLTATAA